MYIVVGYSRQTGYGSLARTADPLYVNTAFVLTSKHSIGSAALRKSNTHYSLFVALSV
jgi:hypothetical protein